MVASAADGLRVSVSVSRSSLRRFVLAAVIVPLLGYAAVLEHYSTHGWGRFVPSPEREGIAELAIKREFNTPELPESPAIGARASRASREPARCWQPGWHRAATR